MVRRANQEEEEEVTLNVPDEERTEAGRSDTIGRYGRNSHNMEIEPIEDWITRISFSSSGNSSSRTSYSVGSRKEDSDDGSNSSTSQKASDNAAGRLNFMNLLRKKKKQTTSEAGGFSSIDDKDEDFQNEFNIRLRNVPDMKFLRIPFRKLQSATLDFSRKALIWKKACIYQYKGHLDGVGQVIIERFFNGNGAIAKELFFAEVRVLALVQHRNIVSGIGWCHRGEDFMVVHELPGNGNLHSHLHSSEMPLPWDARYKISLDIADAILHIHEGYDYCILHRNIQTITILLDSDFNAKLTSFYAAIFGDEDTNSETSSPTWMSGYVDPEYLQSKTFTKASDVFSFGVVLLELATGSQYLFTEFHENSYSRIWELYGENMLLEAVDKRLDGIFNEDQMERLLYTGLLCALPSREKRPSIKDVVRYLNFEDDFLASAFKNVTFSSSISSSVAYGAKEHACDDNLNVHQLSPSEASHKEDNSSNVDDEQFEVGTSLSLKTFNLGIPPTYTCSGYTNQCRIQIIEGFLSILSEKLRAGEGFDEIMKSIEVFTSAIITAGAPIDKWNSLMQYVLRSLDMIENIKIKYNVQIAYQESRTLSSIGLEVEQCAAVIIEDKEEEANANSILASTKKNQTSLCEMFDSLQMQLKEIEEQIKEAKESCHSLEDKIDTIRRRRIQNKEKYKHTKLEYKIFQLYESVLSEISCYSCG